MRKWWQRRTLRFRLAVWFTAVAGSIMLGLTPVVYVLIERRLHAELDRQLHVDWKLIEAHLEADDSGRIQWKRGSPATPSSGYADTWFDVWSGQSQLLSHWPAQGMPVTVAPRPSTGEGPLIYNIELDRGVPARTLQRTAQIGGQNAILRVFRDETGLRQALREVLFGLALGAPLAAALAAAGGYWTAGRTLRPLRAMAEQARQITSESLGSRLPNPNPHDELGEMATVFNETLQRLEASFDSLRRFTADASHELRTPLTALRSVGEVALREGNDVATLRETVGSMLEEAQRLNDLIDSMLLLARAESGRLTVKAEPFRLENLIREVCSCVEILATEKQQRFVVQGDADAMARADRTLLRHAVMNLLHNAVQYSPPGTQITVLWERQGNQCLVEISDEGPGIPPEHRSRIFERFYRVDKARSRNDGGAGLGLAITRLFVEQLGGTVVLVAGMEKGSRFQIRLPAAQ